jgi:hypothetical protein
VTTNAVADSGSPCSADNAGPAKLWTALSDAVVQKKNEKHSHTAGSFRKAIGCSAAGATAAAALLAAGRAAACGHAAERSSMRARCHTSSASTASATTAVPA